MKILNLVKFNKNNVIASTLTKKQQLVYKFVYNKVKSDETINFEEIKQLYIDYGNGNVINGIPHSPEYAFKQPDGSWKYQSYPMYPEEIKRVSIYWFTQKLGVLVVKGALKIIPQIEI